MEMKKEQPPVLAQIPNEKQSPIGDFVSSLPKLSKLHQEEHKTLLVSEDALVDEYKAALAGQNLWFCDRVGSALSRLLVRLKEVEAEHRTRCNCSDPKAKSGEVCSVCHCLREYSPLRRA